MRVLMIKNSDNQNISRDEQFLRLLMSNQEKIYAYILALVHNSNDAEDIMQNVTTVMWRKYDTFKPGTSFIAWGIGISRLLIKKFFEQNRRSKLSFSSDLEEKLAMITAEKLTSEGNSLLEILKECLKKLNPRNHELIRMRYVEKKTVKQIADERGIAPHTMYRIMGKIHETLHRCICRSTSVQESL